MKRTTWQDCNHDSIQRMQRWQQERESANELDKVSYQQI